MGPFGTDARLCSPGRIGRRRPGPHGAPARPRSARRPHRPALPGCVGALRLAPGRGGSRAGDLREGARPSASAPQRGRRRYLLRALRNTFLTQKRTEGRRLRPGPLPDEPDFVADPRAPQPQAALEAGELYAAIASLPDDFRDVLVAVDVTGLSYKEAARALRIREGTVMSRLYRARQQVVRRVEGGSA